MPSIYIVISIRTYILFLYMRISVAVIEIFLCKYSSRVGKVNNTIDSVIQWNERMNNISFTLLSLQVYKLLFEGTFKYILYYFRRIDNLRLSICNNIMCK